MAAALFERLADETWERLDRSRIVGLRFGEEGMTDLLLLEIMRHPWSANSHTMVLVKGKTPKHQEKLYGTDWEWWIGNDRRGWQRYALQAKIIDLDTERYNALSHKVGGAQQVDLLERYARRVGAIPLYVFYNYTLADVAGIWKCCSSGHDSQYGCTITPSSIVKAKLRKRGARNFVSIHSEPQSLPWRCLVKCPRLLAAKSPLAPPDARSWYPHLPSFQMRKTSQVPTLRGTNQKFWPEGLRPKRIVITTIDNPSDGESVESIGEG